MCQQPMVHGSRWDKTAAAQSRSAGLRGRIIVLYAILITLNLLVWGAALLTSRSYPLLLGTALLAYTFGLRHAVDADHIAAIDNVTRKLMQAGQRPISVGLYFALGHSTVVILASVAIVATASALESQLQNVRLIGGLVGAIASSIFLFVIAIANLMVLIGIYRSFQQVRRGGHFVEEDLAILLANRGVLNRVFRSTFRLIGKSWHMYPLGFLFGLGFDTATEIGVLALSALGAAQGLPVWAALIFPALFTAGMTLIDTTDSILMLGAYGWAFVKPIRKLYYNMTITLVSVVIALVVAGIEVLGIIGDTLGLNHGFWRLIAQLNANFSTVGYLIIGIFVVCWGMSALVYHVKGYDRITVTGQ
jgi:high-affinity nickel-transport protein